MFHCTGCFPLQDFVDQLVTASTSSNVARHSSEESAARTQTNADYQYMDEFTDEDFQVPSEYTQSFVEFMLSEQHAAAICCVCVNLVGVEWINLCLQSCSEGLAVYV